MGILNAVQDKCESVVLLAGWRALALAFFAGAVAALGQAPFHFYPALFFSFPVLVFLLDGAAPDADARGPLRLLPAFARGWAFGFGYFFAGLWWLGSAFLVNADRFAVLMPLGVMVLPACLGIFFGLAGIIARVLWTGSKSRVIVLAASFAFVEWLRSFVLTGFPWNHLGYTLAGHDYTMQAIAFIGPHLYAFLAVLFSASLALLVDPAQESNRPWRYALGVPIMGVAIILSFGVLRLEILAGETRFVEGVNLRVVQPNIAQADKFIPQKAGEILQRHISLSERSNDTDDLGLLQTTHLIWPESAFPFLLTQHPQVLARLGALLPPGTVLLAGAVRADPGGDPSIRRRFYNSVYTIDHTGVITDAYDKVHLVPFGEYLPLEATIDQWRRLLEEWGILPFVELPGGFTPGPKQKMMTATTAPPFIPLICYEVIFPVKEPENGALEEAGWILNVTNDAWFGITTGPYQHYHQSRIRAVSEGLPVVRAANNGISAVIDGYGSVLKKVNLGMQGVINAELPEKIKLPVSRSLREMLFWVVLIPIFAFVIFKKLSSRNLMA